MTLVPARAWTSPGCRPHPGPRHVHRGLRADVAQATCSTAWWCGWCAACTPRWSASRRPAAELLDTRQRGDVMSRVTNDVDDVQTTLQQTFRAAGPGHPHRAGHRGHDVRGLVDSALVALLALPLSAVAAGVIGHRCQRMLRSSRPRPASTGTSGVLLGHGPRAGPHLAWRRCSRLRRARRELYRAALGPPVPVRDDHARHAVHLLPLLRGHRGARRAARGHRAADLGDATAFIQYSREFAHRCAQVAGMASCSPASRPRSAFELLDARAGAPRPPPPSCRTAAWRGALRARGLLLSKAALARAPSP
ncbi:hypothetical protein QJS66_09285 [Kocuria rhizophila]|nr:hypothetical protein QJS66_09285 [Kocuria rhizophila]